MDMAGSDNDRKTGTSSPLSHWGRKFPFNLKEGFFWCRKKKDDDHSDSGPPVTLGKKIPFEFERKMIIAQEI